MALLLVLTNTLMLADVHAEALSGQNLPEPELHADGHCGQGEQHSQCHHCCHGQAHFYSLLPYTQDDWFASARDWVPLSVAQPSLTDRAPPVPPPKA